MNAQEIATTLSELIQTLAIEKGITIVVGVAAEKEGIHCVLHTANSPLQVGFELLAQLSYSFCKATSHELMVFEKPAEELGETK